MNPGDKVSIYQKPITAEQYEGEAVLIKHYGRDELWTDRDHLERWLVRFPSRLVDEDDPSVYQRAILVGKDGKPIFCEEERQAKLDSEGEDGARSVEAEMDSAEAELVAKVMLAEIFMRDMDVCDAPSLPRVDPRIEPALTDEEVKAINLALQTRFNEGYFATS